jgi:hypothetical protein
MTQNELQKVLKLLDDDNKNRDAVPDTARTFGPKTSKTLTWWPQRDSCAGGTSKVSDRGPRGPVDETATRM